MVIQCNVESYPSNVVSIFKIVAGRGWRGGGVFHQKELSLYTILLIVPRTFEYYQKLFFHCSLIAIVLIIFTTV